MGGGGGGGVGGVCVCVRVIEVVAVLVARMIKYRLVHACALRMHGDLSYKPESFTAIHSRTVGPHYLLVHKVPIPIV